MSRFPAYPRHSRSAERVLGRHAVWGEEGILPPASVSSSQWFARVFSALFQLVVCVCLCLRCLCLRSPPSHNPLPRFQNSFCGIASASDFCIARLRRRSSKGVDALAEMSEGAKPLRACPTLPCAHNPPAKDKRGRGWGSLLIHKLGLQYSGLKISGAKITSQKSCFHEFREVIFRGHFCLPYPRHFVIHRHNVQLEHFESFEIFHNFVV